MDAAEFESDVKLQKISADLIADFDRSLPAILRKPDGQGVLRIRSRVRAHETIRLTSAVSPISMMGFTAPYYIFTG